MRQIDKNTDIFQKIETYKKLLLKWNKKINLISKNTEQNVDEIHLGDGVQGGRIVIDHFSSQRMLPDVYDLGSGNGIPGVIISILAPEVKVYTVDSDERKNAFLLAVKAELKLENLFPKCIRVEGLPQAERGAIAVSRGFSSVSETLEIIKSKKIKAVYFFKALGWQKELDEKCSTWNIKSIGSYKLKGGAGEDVNREIVLAVPSGSL